MSATRTTWALVAAALLLISLPAACGRGEAAPSEPPPTAPAPVAAMLPRAPGAYSPSLVAIAPGTSAPSSPASGVTTGETLADTDSCSTCHPDAAAQWSQSAHSFASFGNPIYRANVELLRKSLGQEASRHCGGCHDMPLLFDGLMIGKPILPEDLRSHSGVTCRLCHGVQKVTTDGNGSYVWSPVPLDAPSLDDPKSIAAHKAAASVDALGTELCVGCHRGFLSPDLGIPVHLSGIDEPTAWRASPWQGNGLARVDKVAKQTCIDCHMEREPASAQELGAVAGKFASHRFLGGHTWMASMRGDQEHLARTRAKLVGAASIDVAGVRFADGRWQLPADGAALPPAGETLALDVVLRNLLVGHRFPGGVLDMHDTWIEVELTDRSGARLAASGMAHEKQPDDEEAHVLRSLVVDEHGAIREEHELSTFRAVISTHTLAAREAQVVRYAFAVPKLSPAQLPLTVTARLRHRSRTLIQQGEVCDVARSREGRQFLRGAKGARDVTLDPCAPQPITLIAEAKVQLGAGAPGAQGAQGAGARPAWLRTYEHGMALTSVVSERLDEAGQVLEVALTGARALGCSVGRTAAPAAPRAAPAAPAAPTGPGSDPCRAEAMVLTQLAVVAARQGRSDDALRLLDDARGRLVAPYPPALDAIAADALSRVWKWREAVPYARRAADVAQGSTLAWVVLARVLASSGDDRGALAAAQRGLALAPRDADLLRTQATSLKALGSPEAAAALASYDRFRAPDQAAELRIVCARSSARCAREREMGHSHSLLAGKPATGR
jgi:tetratricopeptide (TPR) repeat protein